MGENRNFLFELSMLILFLEVENLGIKPVLNIVGESEVVVQF